MWFVLVELELNCVLSTLLCRDSVCVCARAHCCAGRGQVLLDKGQSDGNKSLLEDPLPHCAAVIVVLLQDT